MKNLFKRILHISQLVIFSLFVWEILRLILINLFGTPEFFLPSSLKIFNFIWLLSKSTQFIFVFFTTLSRIIFVLFIVSALSIIIGTLLGKSKKLYSFLRPLWDFLRSIPPSSLFPIFLLLFGIAVQSKIIISIYFATLVLTLSVADSVISMNVEDEYIWKKMKFKKIDIFMHVIIPKLLNQFFSALRIVGSLIIALIIITEMYIGTTSGLGGAIVDAHSNYEFPKMYALIFFTGTMGFLLNLFIDILYRKFEI